MARCGFFTLDVAWYDEEWFINVPDKDKANVSCLDHSLNGLVMAGYDIPTFKKKHLTPEQVEEKKISFEIPLTEKILKFRRISEVTGWRKGKIIQFLNELEKYGVILFRVEDKLRVSVLHIKAYERLGATQKGYFNALGVNAKTIKAYKIKVAQSYGKISKTQDDDSFPEKENQSSGNENKKVSNLIVDTKTITEEMISYIMSVRQCEKLLDEHSSKLSENQKTWLLERKEILNPSKKNKNFIAG